MISYSSGKYDFNELYILSDTGFLLLIINMELYFTYDGDSGTRLRIRGK